MVSQFVAPHPQSPTETKESVLAGPRGGAGHAGAWQCQTGGRGGRGARTASAGRGRLHASRKRLPQGKPRQARGTNSHGGNTSAGAPGLVRGHGRHGHRVVLARDDAALAELLAAAHGGAPGQGAPALHASPGRKAHRAEPTPARGRPTAPARLRDPALEVRTLCAGPGEAVRAGPRGRGHRGRCTPAHVEKVVH